MSRILIGLTLLLANTAFGQDQDEVRTIPFDGPEIFCHILHNEGARPLHSIRAAVDDPRSSLIIVLGNPKRIEELQRDADGIQQFLRQGGSFLLATDYPFSAFSLGIDIPGNRVTQAKQVAYHGHPECPFLPFSQNEDAGKFARGHPIFHFLSKGLATNCPSHAGPIRNGTGLDYLLDFPPVLLDFPPGVRRQTGTYILGSPKGSAPSGRSLYIAGHGIFMNGMMLQPDNDNFNFAMNVVRWLRDGPDGVARPNVLLMVDGTIITDFDMNLTPPLPPIPIPTVRMLNRLMRGLEQERIPQRIFSDLLGEQLGRFIGIMLAILTLALLIYGTRTTIASRESTDLGKGPTVTPTTASVDGVPLDKQRRQAVLRGWDFAGEAKLLAMDWFREIYDITPDTWHDGVQAELKVTAGFWSHRQMPHNAEWVLRLACARKPTPMKRADFQRLILALRNLSIADRDGRVVLLVDGKNVRQT